MRLQEKIKCSTENYAVKNPSPCLRKKKKKKGEGGRTGERTSPLDFPHYKHVRTEEPQKIIAQCLWAFLSSRFEIKKSQILQVNF